MNDLVERLRSLNIDFSCRQHLYSTIRDSAAEIERLTVENERLRSLIAEGPDRDFIIDRRLEADAAACQQLTPLCINCGKPAVGMICEKAEDQSDPRHRVIVGVQS